ncbi:MAG: sigma-70 family RNA polymerase sigma factor [Planctomycetota bacterium]
MCDAIRFDELYERLNHRLARYFRRLAYGPAESEDLAQETWLRFLAAVERQAYTEQGTPDAFVFRLARNLAFDRMRKRKESTPLDVAQDVPEGIDRYRAVERLELAAEIVRRLDERLDELGRDVLECVLAGIDRPAEIARRLDRHPSSIDRRWRRIREIVHAMPEFRMEATQGDQR